MLELRLTAALIGVAHSPVECQLVEQRLKQVVALRVDERHVHIGAAQLARRRQTAEAAADYDDAAPA